MMRHYRQYMCELKEIDFLWFKRPTLEDPQFTCSPPMHQIFSYIWNNFLWGKKTKSKIPRN